MHSIDSLVAVSMCSSTAFVPRKGSIFAFALQCLNILTILYSSDCRPLFEVLHRRRHDSPPFQSPLRERVWLVFFRLILPFRSSPSLSGNVFAWVYSAALSLDDGWVRKHCSARDLEEVSRRCCLDGGGFLRKKTGATIRYHRGHDVATKSSLADRSMWLSAYKGYGDSCSRISPQ